MSQALHLLLIIIGYYLVGGNSVNGHYNSCHNGRQHGPIICGPALSCTRHAARLLLLQRNSAIQVRKGPLFDSLLVMTPLLTGYCSAACCTMSNMGSRALWA